MLRLPPRHLTAYLKPDDTHVLKAAVGDLTHGAH